jgi:hypothetical protein
VPGISGYEQVTAVGTVLPGQSVVVICPGTKKVIGGGAEVNPFLGGTALAQSRPSGPQAWVGAYTATNGQLHTVTVWAICANVT